MNPETQNLINNTIGNPMNPNTASFMPSGNRFSRFLGWLKSHKKITIFALASALLIGLLGYWFIGLLGYPRDGTGLFPLSSTQPEILLPSSMQLKTPKTTFSQTERILVSVTANSENIPITAFDVAIEYDSAFLTLTKKSPPALKGYEYFGKNNSALAQVSAILKPDQTPQKFNNTTLFDIEFTPKKPGKTTIKIIYFPNSTSESNLLNDKSEDILGIARGVEITIN